MNRSAAISPQTIRLRPATPADIPALYPIHRAAYLELVNRTWGSWNEAWQAANFRENFDCSIRNVIQCDHAIVGYLDVARHPDHIQLAEIVVAPEFQRRGIGAHLLHELLAESRRMSSPLRLQVLKTNHALNWYKSLGFIVTGQTETHFMMQHDHKKPCIRPATPADVPTILSLLRELAAYEKLSHACIATPENMLKYLFGPEQVAEAIVTELDPGDSGRGAKTIVGYALFFKSFSTFLALPGIYLEDLYVQPQHRGHGHGTAMLQYLAHLAVSRGYGRIEWSVLNWNAPSIAFYKSLGAIPLDEWTMYRLTGDALQSFACK